MVKFNNNTIIYKIYCKDPNIIDFYIGRTSNFLRKKQYHKEMSYNPKPNDFLHNFIYNNGGFSNFNMIYLDVITSSNTNRELEKIHHDYIIKEKASLNNNISISKTDTLHQENIKLKNMIDLLIELMD
jgi:hypothetical protein